MTNNFTDNQFLRGSEWRKWDLHVHTPGTKQKNLYHVDDDNKDVWDVFCEQLEASDVFAFGVTDYFSVDNYKKLTKNFNNLYPDSNKVFFPNIEFRINSKNKDGDFIQIHVIFSNESDVVDKIQDFLGRLPLLSTDDEDLTNKYCKEDDLDEIGFDKAIITLENLTKHLNDDFSHKQYVVCGLARGYGSIRPESGDGRGDEYAKEVDKKCQIFFGGSDDVDFFLNKVDGRSQYNLPPKAVFSGSDARSFDDLINKLGKTYEKKDKNGNVCERSEITWIKADLTFEGLRQIIYEPGDRVKIQKRKPDVKDDYSVIDKIVIKDEDNFPGEIAFNSNLCSIIGSRSSGKSALLSLLGYSVDSNVVTEAHKEIGLKDQYVQGHAWDEAPEVEVLWKDEAKTHPNTENNKKIIYIPQNYLFAGYQDASKISKLIMPVLFSQDKQEKRKRELLENYLRQAQQELDTKVNNLFTSLTELGGIEQEIKELGDLEEIRASIENLKEEENQLRKQSQVTEDNLKQYNEIVEKIKEKTQKIQVVENELPILKQYSGTLEISTTSLPEEISEESRKKINKKIEELVETTKRDIEEFLEKYTNDLEDDKKELKKQVENEEEKNQDLINKIKSAKELEKLLKQKNKLKEKLKKIGGCQKKKKRIAQNIEDIIDNLDTKIKDCENKVKNYAKDVDCKIDDDLTIKAEVIQEKEKTTNSYFGLNFHKTLDWKKKSTYWIDNKSEGKQFNYSAFVDSPKEIIRAVLNEDIATLQSFDRKQVIQRLCTLVSQVEYVAEFEGDRVGGQQPSTMTQGKKALFALKMIIGESTGTWPLLIDQPEDDLDSRSIYQEVVPFLREKKKERQIIMVSHDANLVVGADSEQVIVANRKGDDRPNKDNKTFNYKSGSLENLMPKDKSIAKKDVLKSQGIKEHVCEILEGGKEAFNKRRQKYNF
ncbi:MAG: hypothetical protein XD87_0097 [candidate division WS6 bacterium 36_33]|uniref:ATPase involved in DNA repair n=1 Tax=candidate division WS6 bacterium 36_33 TaxID=1641388 RepID=A0A101GZC3_9BACT|nr:MAG: hypothetical protein XD87_0097 [candidate division WS6 bacterium 36_33]